MSTALNGDNSTESRHRSRALAQDECHRYWSIKRFQTVQDLFAEMLNGVAANPASQRLKIADGQAVIRACREIIICRSLAEVEMKADLDTEPLTIPPFLIQNTDMGPEAQIPDMDGIHQHQRGSSRWLNWRVPLA